MYRVHNTIAWFLVRIWPRKPFLSYCEKHTGPTLWERDNEWVN